MNYYIERSKGITNTSLGFFKCPEGFNKYSSMGHTSNQAKFQERTRINLVEQYVSTYRYNCGVLHANNNGVPIVWTHRSWQL